MDAEYTKLSNRLLSNYNDIKALNLKWKENAIDPEIDLITWKSAVIV